MKHVNQMPALILAVLFLVAPASHAGSYSDYEGHPKYSELMERAGTHRRYYRLGAYGPATKEAETALALSIEIAGEKSPLTASMLNNLGLALEGRGDYKRAILAHERALNILLALADRGPDHRETASVYLNFGYDQLQDGSTEKAIGYFQSALKIREKIGIQLDGDQMQIANCYDYLGLGYLAKGDLNMARQYAELALSKKRSHTIPDSDMMTGTYNLLGKIYAAENKHAKALEYFQKTLQIWGQTVGKVHPYYAETLGYIAETYEKAGKRTEALENYERAFKAAKVRLGIDHVATSRYARAITRLEKAKK